MNSGVLVWTWCKSWRTCCRRQQTSSRCVRATSLRGAIVEMAVLLDCDQLLKHYDGQ